MKRLFYTDEKTDNRIFLWYLGFQPSYGWLLVDDITNEARIFLDGRYIDKPIDTKHRDIVCTKVLLDESILSLLTATLIENEEILIEETLPWGVAEKLRNSAIPVQWIFDVTGWQKVNRLKKNEIEKKHIQKAISLTKTIWNRLEILIVKGSLLGKTELEVRGMIVEKAYSLGLVGEAFDTIVASGVNTSIPHHQTGKTCIESGPLLIDMGFVREGWCSDFTRSVRIGEAQGEDYQQFQDILTIAQQAHDTALAAVTEGLAFSELAQIARKVIDDAGYGKYFTHALGHGVGLDVHEAPSVSIKSKDLITSGMVFTIEPGIYLPGKYGVRWENIVVFE